VLAVRLARNAARVIGWLFVGLIGIHAVRAASQAERAASDRNWAHAGELVAIALVATLLVIGAVVGSRRPKRPRERP
jgi:hypothetical protein